MLFFLEVSVRLFIAFFGGCLMYFQSVFYVLLPRASIVFLCTVTQFSYMAFPYWFEI